MSIDFVVFRFKKSIALKFSIVFHVNFIVSKIIYDLKSCH